MKRQIALLLPRFQREKLSAVEQVLLHGGSLSSLLCKIAFLIYKYSLL